MARLNEVAVEDITIQEYSAFLEKMSKKFPAVLSLMQRPIVINNQLVINNTPPVSECLDIDMVDDLHLITFDRNGRVECR